MFNIDSARKTLSNLPIITENLEIVHFDEIPYLYYGTNKYGTKILGSLLDEDDETNNLRYVHTLISNSIFNDFINQKISYRKVLETSSDLFIIDKNINERPIAIYNVSSDIIPVEFLPVTNYYCPNYNYSIGNDFVISLHGNMADAHLAFPIELSKIQRKFEKVLTKTLEIFENLRIVPTVKQKAYAPGSFQLRFNLSFDEYKEMFISQEKLYSTVASILKELIPLSSINTSSEKEIFDFVENEKLIKLISSTIEPAAIKSDEEFINKTINKFEQIISHYSDLSSNIGNGYKEIEILAERKDSKELIPLNLINDETRSHLNEINEAIEEKKHQIEVDEEFKNYKISIYALNTESRSGKALIYNKDDEESMDKPSIKISGAETLDKSLFTESLHLNKWINIRAKATLKDGNYSKLIIESE